jgi:hypothetical protein
MAGPGLSYRPQGGVEVNVAPIGNLLPRLRGVKKTRDGWNAFCPAHDDHHPSLAIAVTGDGTVLVHCRSHGCSAEAICKAIGMGTCDLYAHERNGQVPRDSRSGQRGKRPFNIAAIYDYTDGDGKVLYQVVRLDPKDFRQRRPDPKAKEKWIWNLHGVARVLYRLPALLKAVAEGRTIFIVEGEKDCERLARLGLIATTNVGGAKKWMREYSDALRGANAVILPDNDPPGIEHAAQVGQNLQGVAASVKVLTLPGLPSKGDVSDWLDAGGTAAELMRLTDAAPVWTATPGHDGPSSGGSKAEGKRPVIEITTEEHDVNDQAVAALAQCEALYQRANQLVRIVRDTSPANKGIRREFAPRIEALPAAILRERLAEAARWIKLAEINDAVMELPSRPPGWCVSAVQARGDWRGIRHLEAVLDYPVLRHDGTLLWRPGYDPDTGLLLELSPNLVRTPDNPTREDAIAARNVLLDVVSDFPFADVVHKSAWLAAVLTPAARFAFLGPAPLFLADSNVRGSGKGLLLDCIALIMTGQSFTVATYTNDEDELRKRITSIVLGGDRLVMLDNVAGKFGNAVLDAALTTTAWKDRLLGSNRMAEAPMYMTWFATGNNVMIASDTARRICHIRLESDCERPEERSGFKHPQLLAWVAENRPQLLAAALTILRAYIVAGRPDMRLRAWGSFEGWSSLVRNAVVWVGMPDPGETRIWLQEQSDIAAEGMTKLLNCLTELDPDGHGLTAAKIVEIYKDKPGSVPACHEDLKDSLETLLDKVDSRSLGNRLRAFRRRVFGSWYIDQAGKQQRAARWVVRPANELLQRREHTHETHDTHSPSESGESGESIPPEDDRDYSPDDGPYGERF